MHRASAVYRRARGCHAGFVSSTPSPGSSLSTVPGIVVLEFTEPLNLSGPAGGTPHLEIPNLEARAADDLLDLMTQRMHSVSSFRLTETLGAGTTQMRSEYRVRAPDALHVLNVQADGGWFGGDLDR